MLDFGFLAIADVPLQIIATFSLCRIKETSGVMLIVGEGL